MGGEWVDIDDYINQGYWDEVNIRKGSQVYQEEGKADILAGGWEAPSTRELRLSHATDPQEDKEALAYAFTGRDHSSESVALTGCDHSS